jgi:hypothetical protein
LLRVPVNPRVARASWSAQAVVALTEIVMMAIQQPAVERARSDATDQAARPTRPCLLTMAGK